MKSKNVSLVLKFIPVRGRKRVGIALDAHEDALKFIPVRGRKLLMGIQLRIRRR